MYPRTPRLSLLATLLVVVAANGGCGGSASSPDRPELQTKAVRGPGFVFRAPANRPVTRTDRAVTVLPSDEGSPELESVTRFRLLKPFRPTVWPGVVTELDGAAGKLAAGLSGEIESANDVRVAGRRARRYEIVYEQEGETLRQRITFVFRRREELQLLCRYAEAGAPPAACTLLEQTFRLG